MKLAKYTKFREEKFGAVLFETRSEKVFTLNASAAAVVREISDGAVDLDAILKRLHEHFNNGDGRIEREAGALITELRAKGLLED
jgi:PqqD family protein of HPr-rel-A system